MRKIKYIILIFIIFTGIGICAYAENITDLQSQSTELTEQIDETNNQLKAVQDKLSDAMKQLQEIDDQIASSQNDLNNINIQVDDLMKQISENEEKLKNTQQEYQNLQNLLDKRVEALYETPRLKYLEIILTSDSLTNMLSNYYNITELIEYDKELLNKTKLQKEEIETTKKILAEKKQQIVTDKQTQQKKNQVLSNTRKTREYYMSKLSEEERSLQSQIDEYNKQVSDIETEIKLLAANSISGNYIGGTFTWPVPGFTTSSISW